MLDRDLPVGAAMSGPVVHTLARISDAHWIAAMSRDHIEAGLGWSWRQPRVTSAIRDPETVALKALSGSSPVGFAIMRFATDEAHLLLLAVDGKRRRLGVGRGLVKWLEQTALVAGTGIVRLDVRASRGGERQFYQDLGYQPVAMTPGYYSGRETAVHMAKDLWEWKQTPTDH